MYLISHISSGFCSVKPFLFILVRIVRATLLSSLCLKKMSQEKQHHHLFHRKEDGDEQVPQSTDMYGAGNAQSVDHEKALKEEKHHKHMEELGGLGIGATGGFALHEKHAAKKDPENARRHKIEEEVAAAGAVGEGGYIFHEHHEKEDAEKKGKRI
jgi:hypothetical protein